MTHEIAPETVWGLRLPEIRFGRDAVGELPAQLRALGVEPPASGLLVTDETLVDLGHAEGVRTAVEDDGFALDVFDAVQREPTVESVERCVAAVDGYDYVLGLGGGSCMDTAKAARAVAANSGIVLDYVSGPTGGDEPLAPADAPLVCLPTTAGSGAEVSAVAVASTDEGKAVLSGEPVRADAAVCDPAFAVTLPPALTARCAMDALGPAIEGYTARPFDARLRADPSDRPVYAGRNPLTELFSERAIRLLGSNVRAATHRPEDLDARSAMLLGTLLASMASMTAGSHLCHAMAYPVAERYGTYHGETVGVLTPASTLGYNAASDPPRFARVARLLGADTDGMGTRDAADAARREYVRLQRDLGLPSGLSELVGGVDAADLDWLAARTVETGDRLLRNNPRPATEADVRGVFRDALRNWE